MKKKQIYIHTYLLCNSKLKNGYAKLVDASINRQKFNKQYYVQQQLHILKQQQQWQQQLCNLSQPPTISIRTQSTPLAHISKYDLSLFVFHNFYSTILLLLLLLLILLLLSLFIAQNICRFTFVFVFVAAQVFWRHCTSSVRFATNQLEKFTAQRDRFNSFAFASDKNWMGNLWKNVLCANFSGKFLRHKFSFMSDRKSRII